MADAWINKLGESKRKVYSQGGQDGIVEFVFQNIGTTNKFCVEFGFNSVELAGGSGSNTARLILEDGWEALLLDCDNENLSINLHREMLTPENTGEVFGRYNVPKELDYLSVDVDSIDLWLMKACFDAGYRPRLVSVEYNCNFPIGSSVTVTPGTKWRRGDGVYGASLMALSKMAGEFGYHLVCVERKMDAFFLRGDLAPSGDFPDMSAFSADTGIRFHHTPSAGRLKSFVEYPSMAPLADHPWKCAP